MAYVGEHLMETLNLVLKTLRLTQLEMIEDRQVVGVDGNPFRPREGGDRLLLFLIFQFQLLVVRFPLPPVALQWNCPPV